MATLKTKWHFFIAYAKQDQEAALRLYEQLTKVLTFFLISSPYSSATIGIWCCILTTRLLDNSGIGLPETPKAYYQREEIAAAIELARKGEGHRVVPVYLVLMRSTPQLSRMD